MTAGSPNEDPAIDREAIAGASDRPVLTQSFLQSVVETANEGIWMIDLKSTTIFANERMAKLLGTTPADMIGRPVPEFCFPEDISQARSVIAANFEGRSEEFEFRFRRPDGSEVPVLGGTAPLRDQHGRITGSLGMFSDLTSRKAAELALMKSEHEATKAAALLNQLLESAIDAIWMRDTEGRFQVTNPAAADVMGHTRDELIGAPMTEIWPPEVAARLRSETEEIFRQGKGITVEEEMLDAGKGRITTFLSNKVPLYDPDGAPMGVLGVSRDITDRKRVENDLRASEARLAQQVAELNALYDSAPIGLAFFSRDYRYVRINRELALINGIAAEDHIGRTIGEVLPVNAPIVEPIIDRIFATGEAVRDLEVTGETPQQPGIERHWLTGFYPVFTEDGTVEAVGAWVVEISERIAAEQREVLLAREVDHRAKNLLAVVQSIVTLTPATDGAELKTSVVGRIQALARAHSLLSDSRWDGVDLGQLVEEELAPFAAEGRHRLSYEGPPLKLRPAAAQSLALVLHELATNAAKYGALSNEVGKVQVEWRRDQDDRGAFIEILWVESGGPEVIAPDSLGFGSNIIQASVERQLRGKVVHEWRREGLLARLRIPAAEVVPGPDA